jgi:hypothetical protein
VEYAYRVNARRSANDPLKRDHHPLAVVLFPIWPVWIAVMISLFILRALAYGVFLILFTVALIVIRKPFIFIWLEKVALNVGNKLLRANMLIVRLFFPKPVPQGI